MPAAGGGGQQEPDNSLAPMWITLGLFIVAGFIWHYFYEQIIQVIFTLRTWEADLMGIFVPHMWAQELDTAKQFMITAKAAGYDTVSFADVMTISQAVGTYLRIPVIAILFVLATILYLKNPISRYKKTYSMKTLLTHERVIWPHVTPVVKLDLVNQDIHKGPWAMALTPMNYAKKHNLLTYEKPKSTLERFETKQPPTADIIRDEARKSFALQLGRFWSGPEALPIHARALFAVFAARINGDRDSAAKLQEQISRSAGEGKLNFSGADDLLKKHKDNKHIIKLCQRHAFEHTVLASVLELARQDGVLPSAEFLWLKPTDRRLWFLLNSVGRQTPFVEVAGIFAHWIAEKEFGKSLNVPMIEEAVNGLEAAIKEIIYKPEED